VSAGGWVDGGTVSAGGSVVAGITTGGSASLPDTVADELSAAPAATTTRASTSVTPMAMAT
jgi:hypothetical protein